MPLALTSLMTLLAAAAGQAAPPAAQAPNDAMVSADHQPAALDRLLAARDYEALGARVAGVRRQADLMADLNWLKARMMEGNGAFVTMLYARLLWVGAEGLPDEPRSQLRQTALMASFYALAAIAVDGARCGDRSAPEHRIAQLMNEWNPTVWPFAATLTGAQRETIVKVALALEARTAARRDAAGDVDFVCRAGMEETSYNLQHGTQKEVPTAPGRIGRTIVLVGDGKYVPSQRPEAEWRKDVAAVRARLPEQLARLMASLAAPAAPAK
ncbi:MAG: hypothetical protein JO013_06025 [Alphaproteobacteria bacterium]|nr:hypothetical protein [Alphaproteobacteria bacterium]